MKNDKVYELKDQRILLVFDEVGTSMNGRGNIWPRDRFEKFIHFVLRHRDDIDQGRRSSVDHWYWYSKYKERIVDYADETVTFLSRTLNIKPQRLTYEYPSLDLISEKCLQKPINQIFEKLYDHLVLYVGEVIKRRVKGKWALDRPEGSPPYPYISIDSITVKYMPTNIIWEIGTSVEDIDLRKLTANEIRTNGFTLKMEREGMFNILK